MALTQISTEGIKNGTITGSDLATNVDLVDNQKLRFGTSSDKSEIYNDGNDLFINHTEAGYLQLQGNYGVLLQRHNGTENLLRALSNGAVELFYDNNKKFETTTSGVTVTGGIITDGVSTFGTSNGQNNPSGTSWATDSRLNLYGSFGGGLSFNDNGNAGYVQYVESGGAIFNLKAGAVGGATEQIIRCVKDGAVELYHDNSKKFETTSAGALITGKLETTGLTRDGDITFERSGNTRLTVDNGGITVGGDIKYNDNYKIKAGTGADLEIYHDGTASFITNTTGGLNLNDTGGYFRVKSDDIKLEAANGEDFLECDANGAVSLYYDASKKFETTSTGITAQSSGDFQFKMLGNNGNEWGIYNQDNNLRFMEDSSERMRIDSSGNVGIGTSPSSRLHVSVDSSETTRTSESTVFIKNTNNSASTCASLHLQASGSSSNIYKISTQKHSGGSGSEFHLDKGTNAIMQISGDNADIKFGVNGTMISTFTPGLSNNTVGLGLEPRNGSIFLSRSNGAALYVNVNTDGSQLATFRRNGNEQGKIIAHSQSVSYETTSDYRLKENAVAISDGITRLKQLKPYKFNFKSNSSETLDGFFAHEAQTVVPECASGTKDQVVVQAQVDSEVYKESELGNPIYQGIDQSKLVPLLVAAVQEAIGKIEVLETEVAALKAA